MIDEKETSAFLFLIGHSVIINWIVAKSSNNVKRGNKVAEFIRSNQKPRKMKKGQAREDQKEEEGREIA